MVSESNAQLILDEIDRLVVTHEKAKEYLTKISHGIEQHLTFWQSRRAAIAEQMNSHSIDFLLNKTQRINELTIDAVQNLCRVDILIEQVLRLEPKLSPARSTMPMTSSFSSRSLDRMVSPSTNSTLFPNSRLQTPVTSMGPSYPQPVPNPSNFAGRTLGLPNPPATTVQRTLQPTPVAPTPPVTLSGRLPNPGAPQTTAVFKPIPQQQQQPQPSARPESNVNSRPPAPHTRPSTTSSMFETASHRTEPAPTTNYSSVMHGGKVRVQLQRIPPGTRWARAKIEVIDSLSAFYVANYDPDVRNSFNQFSYQLNEHYDELERSRKLPRAQSIDIGDFGVIRFVDDQMWYRARVVKSEEEGRIRVLLIDSGHLDIKFLDEFFSLDPQFATLPAQAIGCTLSQAFPPSSTDDNTLWPSETIEMFRHEVQNKTVEVRFVETDEITATWPLHFVLIMVNNQSITSFLASRQLIDPKANQFIAEQLSATLQDHDYILFNVDIDMQSMNDLNTVELLDDVDNLLFLCDRLQSRLSQVTSYVDDLKQLWINKRRAIESDSTISPIVAQKASKCNKVLLNVAEKLATVELQTESLHHLQSTMSHHLNTMKKPEVSPSMSSFNGQSTSRSSSSMQMNPLKQEFHDSASSMTTRGLSEQRTALSAPTPSHASPKSAMTGFRGRETLASMNDTSSIKSSMEPAQQQSAFHRPLPSASQMNPSRNQNNQSPVKLVTPPVNTYASVPKPVQNGPMFNGTISNRPAMQMESAALKNGTSSANDKVRVKMQVIKPGTVWKHADIPITDHPSAFFACNQDPRVTEQFNLMSIEMNSHYNKSGNATAPLQDPAIGDFCVARFSEDNYWYRARVVLKRDDSILIVFIDYGNSESKALNEIYPMQEFLTRLPAMAVACTLADAFPNNKNFWTPEETDVFNRLVKNRIVEVHFLEGGDDKWPLHFVKIILDDKSITQHPQLASYITPVRNEQIAMHFNDKLTSMEYILYNVAVVESDIYTGNLP